MARLMLSAAHKSSGKTTVSIGLCVALRERGLDVNPLKKGPDYIDPMWLARAAAKPCYNLDFYTSTQEEILRRARDSEPDTGIALIEGNKGLYDGLDLEGTNSNAALARLLRAPVILVLDVRGTIRGVAPLLIGYLQFDPQVRIAGVILNQVGGRRHESKLRAVIERYTDLPVLGAVWRDPRLELVERHLGLMPSNEATDADRMIDGIGQAISEQVNLSAVIDLARSADSLPAATGVRAPLNSSGQAVRLAIARDPAFGFYYSDDLEALERAGARLVAVDLMRDERLPSVDGLIIGGGFPETQMQGLEGNRSMRHAIAAAIEAGMPAYAECGGLMYLSRSVVWGDRRAEMAGVIQADTVMCDTPQGRGYVRLRETEASPWPRLETGGPGAEIAAHEFHYSKLVNLPANTAFAYEMLRGAGVTGRFDGLVYKNLLASYTHMRDTRQNPWAARFVAFVRGRQSSGDSVRKQRRGHEIL